MTLSPDTTSEDELRKILTNRMSLLQVEDHHINGISQADEARLESYVDTILSHTTRATQEASIRGRIDELTSMDVWEHPIQQEAYVNDRLATLQSQLDELLTNTGENI